MSRQLIVIIVVALAFSAIFMVVDGEPIASAHGLGFLIGSATVPVGIALAVGLLAGLVSRLTRSESSSIVRSTIWVTFVVAELLFVIGTVRA